MGILRREIFESMSPLQALIPQLLLLGWEQGSRASQSLSLTGERNLG